MQLPPTTWHEQTTAQALTLLRSGEGGLTSAEASRRLLEGGRNELAATPPPHPLALFAAQFRSVMVALLVASALLSGLVGEWVDAAAIVGIVLLNALLGAWQEYGAERSIAALRRMTAPRARVVRDGVTALLAAAELVPGDVVLLEAGDLVPADARLLSAAALRCVESALTGESEAVEKQVAALPVAAPSAATVPLGDRRNLVFLGTAVAAGTARAVVCATGAASEMGRVATLLDAAAQEQTTPLQRRLDALGRVLVFGALAIVALLFVVGWLRGTPLIDQLLLSVSLAVAAVPEGLPAVITIALSVGVLRMSRRHALVRKLPAVETLGSTTVICTDKTGTLTLGRMEVLELVPAEVASGGAGKEAGGTLATAFAAACDAQLGTAADGGDAIGDPTEVALLLAARAAGEERSAIEARWPRLRDLPFDPQRRLMSVVRRLPDGRRRLFVKGGPDELLGRCVTSAASAAQVRVDVAALASRGLRVLAAGQRDLEDGESLDSPAEQLESRLVFTGLAAMRDPPRPGVAAAIASCRAAGIRVAMITGDHASTALAIAREIGIAATDDLAIHGADLDLLDDAALDARLDHAAVFARVAPEHKLRIVRAWKRRGEIVAMTGDGVNDAPALRAADVGIAMGLGGTEVAKEAAHVVLADDRFETIVAAVEEGRGIWDNLKKTLGFLFASNTGEVLFVAGCVFAGYPTPLLPIHLLWINLVTDGLPAICLAIEPIERDVMRRPPRDPRVPLADGPFVRGVLAMGAVSAAVAFAVWLLALKDEPLADARTHAFSFLVFDQLFRSLGARSRDRTVPELGLFTNPRLAWVVALSLLLQFVGPAWPPFARLLRVTPFEWREGLLLLAAGALPVTLLELSKLFRRAVSRRRESTR